MLRGVRCGRAQSIAFHPGQSPTGIHLAFVISARLWQVSLSPWVIAICEPAPAVVGMDGYPSFPSVIPACLWQGSIWKEAKMDSRYQLSGMTQEKDGYPMKDVGHDRLFSSFPPGVSGHPFLVRHPCVFVAGIHLERS